MLLVHVLRPADADCGAADDGALAVDPDDATHPAGAPQVGGLAGGRLLGVVVEHDLEVVDVPVVLVDVDVGVETVGRAGALEDDAALDDAGGPGLLGGRDGGTARRQRQGGGGGEADDGGAGEGRGGGAHDALSPGLVWDEHQQDAAPAARVATRVTVVQTASGGQAAAGHQLLRAGTRSRPSSAARSGRTGCRRPTRTASCRSGGSSGRGPRRGRRPRGATGSPGRG